MKEHLPRILIFTVNGWNNTTGTSTISSIIDGYPPENVANIFIRSDEPNSVCCRYYYRISEKEVLKSVFLKKTKTGRDVSKKDTKNINYNYLTERNQQNKLKKCKNFLTPYIRDLVWKLSNWYSDDLKLFIKNFDPQIIMTPAEGLIHFNNIALTIKKDFNVKLGLFFWDDNFTYNTMQNPLNKMYRFFLRKSIRRLVNEASFGFSIVPKMQKECNDVFNFETVLLTKPVQCTGQEQYRDIVPPIKILYTGSIYIGRDATLIKLINCIKILNEHICKYRLDIYTNSFIDEKLMSRLNVKNVSFVHPAVTKEKVLDLQKEADILLFVEAIDGKYKNTARLSFSTKLVDYFGAGKCIFAIAPYNTASMEYLKKNHLALTAETIEEINSVLSDIYNNPNKLKSIAEHTRKFANKYHTKEVIFNKFIDAILQII